MSNQNRIKAVLFDLDDTLIDWSKKTVSAGNISRIHVTKMRDYLEQQGHDVPNGEAFYKLFHEHIIASWTEAKKTWSGVNFGNMVWQTLEAAKLDMSTIKLQDVLTAYDWQPIPGIRPYDDTLEVLNFLKKNGYKIGLITNAMQPMWMRDIELEAYGLLSFFDSRVTSGDVGFMKPHPQIYMSALEPLGVELHEAVFVGDRPGNDVVGANQVGMTSVWIDPPHLDYELDGVVPDYKITHLFELLPILVELEKQLIQG